MSNVNMPASSTADQDNSMETASRQSLPRSVKVLASLYLLVGTLALIEFIWTAFHDGTLYVAIYAIGYPLGVGLLARSPVWRKLALIAAVAQILVLGLAVYLLYSNQEEFADLWPGLSAKIEPLMGKVALGGALAILAVAVLAVSIWSIRLLTRKDVKRLFQANVNCKRRFGWLWAIALVSLVAMTSRETGGFSLHYFTWSEEGLAEENRDEPRNRVVLGGSNPWAMEKSFELAGFEAPCLIEVQGMGEEWYGVATTFDVKRDFYDYGGGSTDTKTEWKSYGGRAVSEISPTLRNSQDRIVVEVDQPQFSGTYWLPLSKHLTAEYRARIHGEGKYEGYRDELNEKRNVIVSGPCSVHDLKEHLRKRTIDIAIAQIMNRAEQTAKGATWLMSEASKEVAAKDYDRAIDIFNQALRLGPGDGHAFRRRGDAWLGKDDYDRALQDYDQAIHFDPKDHLAFNNRGWTWYLKKDYDRAIQNYDESLRLFPTALTFRNRGHAWLDKKEYDKAIQDYGKAIRLNPEDVHALNNRGLAWYHKKEYGQAIKDYDEAIRLDPKFVVVFINRGIAWSARKDYDKAIENYEQAIRLEPKDLYPVIFGHLAARQAGDEPAAKRFLKDSAGKMDETWPYPVIQFLCGDIDQETLLKRSTDIDKQTDAHCFLGMDHAIKEHKAEALTHLRWVKEHGNTDLMAYTIAVAELDQLERPAEGPKRQ
jgi:tetratricopeptide (TPR) repeat protein